ncbi:hypothetical protein [Tenacibaculum geojense]|uniref:Transmembrane protein n=1 Tax=Tenacibaculum geojense TaxID=915352 RepID=A0ABW3JS64_9FLAO
MYQKIDEELRQYKLFKIQETENKLKKYNKVYNEIKQNNILKLSKNASSNIIVLLSYGVALFTLILAICFLFPDAIMEALEIEFYNEYERKEAYMVFKILAITLFFTCLIFSIVGILLRKNNKKRNHIFNLSVLLEDVMAFMEKSSYEDKRKYEYFVDSIAEREKVANQN